MCRSGHSAERHERALVILAQARDSAAFRQLVIRYERRLVYYIRRMIGNESDAFDVMQEVWLLVFRKLSSLEAPEAFRVWLYKIAHDVTVSHIRRQSNRKMLWVEEIAVTDETDTWNELEALENVEMVHRALEQLTPAHREVLTLRFLEGLNIAEIAEVVGLGIGTVKSRLHYAKRSLREQIEGVSHG